MSVITDLRFALTFFRMLRRFRADGRTQRLVVELGPADDTAEAD